MILFVDDEKRGIDSFVQELRFSSYKVESLHNVDSAYKYLKQNFNEVELVILDIMMPSGEILKDTDTEDGVRTGVQFSKIIRKEFPNLPILIFTNVSDEELEKKCIKDKKIRFFHKYDFLPFELVDAIKQFLEN